jgi:hypothetical protein
MENPPSSQKDIKFSLEVINNTWLKTGFLNEIKLDNIVKIWMSEQLCHISDMKKYKMESLYPTW